MRTVELFFELIRYTIKGEPISELTKKGVCEEQLANLFALSKNHDCTHLITYALYKNGLYLCKYCFFDRRY